MCNPWIRFSNSTLKLAEAHWGKSRVIKQKTNSLLVPSCSLETRCFYKSSNLMLALDGESSFRVRQKLGIFCHQESFLCISIFRSLPSLRILHHMTNQDYLCTGSSTHHSFISFKCCSPSFFFSFILSSISWRRLELSVLLEYLTMNNCGNLCSSSPINSGSESDHLSLLMDWAYECSSIHR